MFWVVTARLVGALVALCIGIFVQRILHQRRIAAELHILSAQGITEERFVKIGGIQQWIGIRGEDQENPILLIVHGGPGSPCSIFTPRIRSWEKYLTLVQWDQRGCGKTLGRTGQGGADELTMDRLAADGIEVAAFVCERLNQNKVVLLACSFGSTFGLAMIRNHPELFSAYVGTGQNVGILRDQAANYRATVERLRARGLKKGASALEKIGSDPSRWTAKDFTAAARWTLKSDPHEYEGIMKLVKSALWFSPGYSLRGIKLFLSGMKSSIARLFPEVRAYDAWRAGTQFEVPFFIFQGENDVVTPPSLVTVYFNDVVAPIKEMSLLRDAGHFAAFTQLEQFLRKLLTRVRPLVARKPLSSSAA